MNRGLAARLTHALQAPPEPSPFELPASLWTLISQRVYFVNDITRGGPYTPFKNLGTFPALAAATAEWRTSTFKRLAALASTIQQHGRTTVPQLYDQLAAALTSGSRTDAVNALAAVKKEVDRIASEAASVALLVTPFHKANAAFDRELAKQPESAWLSLVARPKEVDEAVGKLQGDWQAIAHDLQSVSDALAHDAGDMLPVDVIVAKGSWATYAGEIDAFSRGAAQQERVIDGRFITPIVSIRQARDGAALQSVARVNAAPGDRMIVFGVPSLDGRQTVVRIEAPEEKHDERRNERTYRWGCVIDSHATPDGGWQSLYNRFIPNPALTSFGMLSFDSAGIYSAARAEDGKLLISAADETEFAIGDLVGLMGVWPAPDPAHVTAKTETTNAAGDRVWQYKLDIPYTRPLARMSPFAGMYRDES